VSFVFVCAQCDKSTTGFNDNDDVEGTLAFCSATCRDARRAAELLICYGEPGQKIPMPTIYLQGQPLQLVTEFNAHKKLESPNLHASIELSFTAQDDTLFESDDILLSNFAIQMPGERKIHQIHVREASIEVSQQWPPKAMVEGYVILQ